MEKSYLYTGKPIKPPFALNIDGKTLVQGEDYYIEILDNVDVGTAHVYISGRGNYTGKYEYTFEIEPVPARTLSFFAEETEFAYDGQPKTMQITVRFGEMTLVEGKDYTIAYDNNIAPGKATALLTFQGNFTGVMAIPFTIQNTMAPLVNTSTLSASEIHHGETVTLSSSAEGGSEEYQYVVVYKKTTDKKWSWVQALSSKTSAAIKPLRIGDYVICSRVEDSVGNTVKKFFPLKVTK